MRVLTPVLLATFLTLSPSSLKAQTVAVPPSEGMLDRANLKTEWTTAIPITGRQDGIALIQPASGGQVFVQTKGGQLIALDSKSGTQQWSQKLGGAGSPAYPVAYNDRYVVAVNLVSLYLIQRYNGLIEFQVQLPLVPSAGPVIERGAVYVIMNGTRVTAYELPDSLRMPEKQPKIAGAFGNPATNTTVKNPADEVAKRYPSSSRNIPNVQPQFEDRKVSLQPSSQIGSNINQVAPSLSILPTARPPYSVFDDRGKYIIRSESLSTVHSMQQPYSLLDPTQAHIQRTPSIGPIPPSLAALYQQTSLLPRPFQPSVRWVYGSTSRLTFAPLKTNFRLWLAGDSPTLQSVLIEDKALQITARIPNIPAAQPSQGDDIGYFPLVDGNLLAIDLSGGTGSTYKQQWRANVGGAMNRSPLVTFDSIFQGGDSSGVARVNRDTGEVIWRTEQTADTLLAANDENVFVRDKSGALRVYDRNRIEDAVTKRAVLLASADLSNFNVTALNDKTDRIFLGADSGMLICLRDKSAKYLSPLTVGPMPTKPDPFAKKIRADGGITSTDTPAPMGDQAKKEEMKKEEMKKEEMKKEEPKKPEPKKPDAKKEDPKKPEPKK
jgi:outer membrane protein assembly factor BamB